MPDLVRCRFDEVCALGSHVVELGELHGVLEARALSDVTEVSSTTITCREVSPSDSRRSARIWVSDELGKPVPVSRSARTPSACSPSR